MFNTFNNTLLTCSGDTSVVIPPNIKSVGWEAFKCCATQPAKITFSEGLQNIQPRAFLGCHQLQSLNFPNSLKYIGDTAFRECSSLCLVILPENISHDSIAVSAFINCTGLKVVVTPNDDSVTFSCFPATCVQIKWCDFYAALTTQHPYWTLLLYSPTGLELKDVNKLNTNDFIDMARVLEHSPELLTKFIMVLDKEENSTIKDEIIRRMKQSLQPDFQQLVAQLNLTCKALDPQPEHDSPGQLRSLFALKACRKLVSQLNSTCKALQTGPDKNSPVQLTGLFTLKECREIEFATNVPNLYPNILSTPPAATALLATTPATPALRP